MITHCKLILIVLVFASTISACNKNKEDADPAFQKMQPAPRNDLLHFDPIQQPTVTYALVPRSGLGPLVRVVRDGAVLAKLSLSGNLVQLSDSLFRLTPDTGHTITIGFALPPGFHLRGLAGTVMATVEYNDASSLLGADEQLVIVIENKLYAGYLWKVNSRPIIFGPHLSVSLVQSLVDTLPKSEPFRSVQAHVSTSDGLKTVPTRGLFDFKIGQNTYTLFTELSLYQNVQDSGGDGRSGYVLRGIIGLR